MAYTEAPQSLTSQAKCLPASIYNSIPPDNGHLTWAGSMSGAPISGYQSGPSSLHGTLYSAVSAHPYSGNYASVGPETTAAHHMAAISGEYQAARLQRAPPHGHSARYYTHRAIAAHPYGAIQPGYDMATFRQKTATKETTSTLKAWLRDHKTNPYPNKGDKVMLAMVSRMTLTQVSTWFANARRRMKKDKTDYMDGNHSDSEYGSKGDTERAPSDRVPRCHGEHVVSTADDTNAKYTDTVTESADRVTESTDNIIPPSKRARKCIQRLFSPDGRTDISIDTCSSPESTYGIYCAISPDADHDFASRRVTHPSSPLSPVLMHAEKTETLHRTSSGTGAGSNKSKIWSITDIIGTKSETPHTKTDDVNTSPDTHTYSSSNGSLPSIYASQTDLYQSWLASQTNTAVFEHYEGSIASCELLEHC